MRVRFSGIGLADVVKTVLVPLVAGWIVALGFGLLIAKLQYDALLGVFSAEQLVTEYQGRIEHVLRQGPLLWLPQVGVVAGLLAWQVGRLGRNSARPSLFGGIAGTLLATIEGGIALTMQVPILLVVVLCLIIIGSGIFAGWNATGAIPRQTDAGTVTETLT